ncbi:adenosine kinase [Sphingopyxis alaskensis]|jgi:sugar/nucleoside kinase (ribokinase family)|uniref:PfkB n=1 Tax=Sphingopyxis alaskensis (strain DSM 13593 / LMG 18877 / RB2256) TaxID=317655 RepID=Q1GP45_SPHAL|nr:adenosine kinase [Sphingopyxis alaskensis]ABF54577.1 PfkB [Sphingopyxis alaskensis RB2256]MCM3418582.1 adenosine kinase [Sphingopyxis alaskensis]
MAATARFDVVAIGNAIVDVLARADDALIEAEGLTKGSMRLIDGAEAERLYAAMGPAIEMSGGSAANTLAGMAALGERCAFIGQVADDQLGAVFTHDLRALGVAYETPALKDGAPTARCLILVTPDGQRTMNTFLGASHLLDRVMIDEAWIADAEILYLEGYLWDPPLSRAAMRRAIDVARAAGRKVAFTLSDAFIIERHGPDFRALIAEGLFDILFANEVEIRALAETQDFEAAVARIAPQVPLLVVTRGSHGALAIQGGVRTEVPAEPIETVVDTTGAGDLFAAGFLSGLAEGRPIADCLTMGAVCAREIIAQVGPRAQTDLKAKVAARLG